MMKNILKYKDWINETLDVLTYHKKLNPNFWNEKDELDPIIRKKLLRIARDFFESLELETEILDIYLMGSMSNYNYTKSSDLDTHIVIDYEDLGDRDLVEKAVDGERFQWNTRHHIRMRGHDVELYIQDINDKKPFAGIYSLVNNKWVQKPEYDPPKVTDEDILPKYNSYVYEISELEKIFKTETNPEELEKYYIMAKNIKKKLSEARAASIKASGEFSIENLVFKKLRNEGFIGKLIEVKNGLYDKMFAQ
jgi:predicted nucleotidyltransferase